jgi:hypothetical protein
MVERNRLGSSVHFLQRHYAVLLILVLAALNILPVLWKGVAQGDDLNTHLSYFQAFLQEIGPNNLYPRWLSTLDAGQGSPIFLIQYPLPYFFLLALYWPIHIFTRMDVVSAARALEAATFFILMASSGWAAYEWLKSWCSRGAALFGSLVYVFAPYHFTVNSYERFALGELVAYSLIPVLLLYTRRLVSGRKSRTHLVGVSVFLAVLLCSHPISAAMLLPLIFLEAFLSTPVAPARKPLGSLGIALVLGILLSSFYVFPLASDFRSVEMHPTSGENYLYDENYLQIPTGNLIASMQQHDVPLYIQRAVVRTFGFLGPNFTRERKYATFTAVVSLVDNVLIILAATVCLFITYRWWQGRNLIVWVVIGILSIYVQTYPSHWIADLFTPLKAIQFPWRFSTLTCLAFAAVAADCCDRIRTRQTPRFRLAGMAAAVFVLLGSGNLLALRHSNFRSQAVVTGIDADQYRSVTGREFKAAGDAHTPLALVQSRLPVAGRSWRVVRDSSGAFVIHANFTEADTITINLICFPGWKAIDLKTRRPIALGCDETRGFASIAIPKGSTDIKMFFPPRASDYFGRWLSFVVAISLLAFGISIPPEPGESGMVTGAELKSKTWRAGHVKALRSA